MRPEVIGLRSRKIEDRMTPAANINGRAEGWRPAVHEFAALGLSAPIAHPVVYGRSAGGLCDRGRPKWRVIRIPQA